MNLAVIIGAIIIIGIAAFFFVRLKSNGPSVLHLGPIIGGRNYTKGVTLEGRSFKFPYPHRDAGHVHALVQPVQSVAGKLTCKWSIAANAGTTIHPQESPDAVGEISLMIQRKGDDYNAKGKREFYRLYAPGPQFMKLGNGEMTAELTPAGWIGVFGIEPTQAQFDDVMQNVATIQLCFGGGGSRAHGVYSSAPATFTLIELAAN